MHKFKNSTFIQQNQWPNFLRAAKKLLMHLEPSIFFLNDHDGHMLKSDTLESHLLSAIMKNLSNSGKLVQSTQAQYKPR